MPIQHIETVSRKLSTENDAPKYLAAYGVDDGEFQFASIWSQGKTIYLDRNELVALIETVFLTDNKMRLEFAQMFESEHGITQ